MKTKKIVARILAVFLTLSMLIAVSACGINSYNTNPMVAKCGDVKLYLDQYLNLFNNTDTNSNMYYMYYMYGALTIDAYREVMLEQLVNYGVQLNHALEMGITLDEDEKNQIQETLNQQIDDALASFESRIDKTLTDKDEIREAEMELFVEALKANGATYDEYVENLEESLYNSALIDKMYDMIVADVTVDNDTLQTYYDKMLVTTTTVSSFYTSFTKFFDGSEGSLPMYMPIPGAEDEESEEDTDEADKEEDKFSDIFSVMHCFIEFEETEDDEEPSFDKIDERNIADIEDALESGTLTMEEFLNDYCFNTTFGDDPGMWRDCYQFFGYMMHEELISKYYDGFGYAAMKLMYGDEWEPEVEDDANTATEDDEEEAVEYELTFYDLADGENAVVKVMTDSGVHYITLNPNDCYNMYNSEGKLIVAMYDGETPVTDEEGIVTTVGHITAEELEAIDLTFSHAASAEDAEADNKAAEALQGSKEDDEDEDAEDEGKDDVEPTQEPEAEPTAEPTAEPDDTDVVDDADDEEVAEDVEEGPYMTCKKLYDQYLDNNLVSLQDEKYQSEFDQWKEETKIRTKPNVVSTLTFNAGM